MSKPKYAECPKALTRGDWIGIVDFAGMVPTRVCEVSLESSTEVEIRCTMVFGFVKYMKIRGPNTEEVAIVGASHSAPKIVPGVNCSRDPFSLW